jgi:hypothetical protein
MQFSPISAYTPLSMPETFSLLDRLSRQGLQADEAVHLVDEINHQAKQVKQPAQAVLEDWLLQQQLKGRG